jgi:2'-5' RNA ligase
MARLFLAVWPPDHVVDALRALRRKDRRGVRFIPPDRWHVTLRFLGDALADDVAAAMDDVPAAATARLGPAVDVVGERVLAIPVVGLDDLAETVTRRTRDLGERPPRRRFRGHLTIARIKPYADLAPTIGALVEAAFEVKEVALVQSRLEPDGARYETLETWTVG